MMEKFIPIGRNRKIWIMDPTTLRSRLFERLLFETKIKSINELEWIDGKFTVMCIKRCHRHNKP
jgi:hypothetical protein